METRADIEAKLECLHKQRGAALLAGKKFDNSVIVAEHEKLAALTDLDNARVEQQREEEARQRQAAVTAINREIEDLMAASAKALAESRTAYHQAAALMR